jgi:uncharacterized protein
MARGVGNRAGRTSNRRWRVGRPGGCLIWALALLVIVLLLSILFGGFQRGTKVGGQNLVRPRAGELLHRTAPVASGSRIKLAGHAVGQAATILETHPEELLMADVDAGVVTRLRAALAEALRDRDSAAASAVRSALAAIGNAEAIGVAADSARTPPTSAHFAGATAGLGSAEAPRRALSDDEIAQIVRAEITERQAAARQYDELNRSDQAARLRGEADIFAATLDWR